MWQVLDNIIKSDIGRTSEDIQKINKMLNPGEQRLRYIDCIGWLPAPPTGLALLEQKVRLFYNFVPRDREQWIALACYYLGSIIRCHSFHDGNGRTGRALYALCHLWGKVPFQAVKPAFERTLTGMGE